MEDTVSRETLGEARAVAELIREHNGAGTVVLDISSQNSFADYFVISTVSSFAHLRGLARRLDEHIDERGLRRLNRQRKIPDDDEWMLIDLGSIVVHLMTEKARGFYELEKLWFAGTVVYPD